MGAPKYIKQLLTEIKRKTDSNTVIGENINTPLTSEDRSSRQKNNKKTMVFNERLDQMEAAPHHRSTKDYKRILGKIAKKLDNLEKQINS